MVAKGQETSEEWRSYLVCTRAATFRNWPFTEGCSCTPERMAAAGFVHCPSENSPDVVQCFFCFKELEGWEPDDDPFEEHKKHSPRCAFISLQKDLSKLTLQEFLKLDRERVKNATKKGISRKVNDVQDEAKIVRQAIMSLAS